MLQRELKGRERGIESVAARGWGQIKYDDRK
jgi:hypothetical protein